MAEIERKQLITKNHELEWYLPVMDFLLHLMWRWSDEGKWKPHFHFQMVLKSSGWTVLLLIYCTLELVVELIQILRVGDIVDLHMEEKKIASLMYPLYCPSYFGFPQKHWMRIWRIACARISMNRKKIHI